MRPCRQSREGRLRRRRSELSRGSDGGSSPQVRRDELRDLHRVERRTLAQVVVRDEERESPSLRCTGILADATHIARVVSRGFERGRNIREGDAWNLVSYIVSLRAAPTGDAAAAAPRGNLVAEDTRP